MREYRNETEQNDMKKTDQMLEKYPESLYLFIRGIEFHTTPKTRLEYVKNIGIYLEYIADQDGIVPKDVTTERLEQVTKTYIEEYLHYLRYYEKREGLYQFRCVDQKEAGGTTILLLFHVRSQHDQSQWNEQDKTAETPW